MDAPNEARNALKSIMIEFRVTRILANFGNNANEVTQNYGGRRCETLPGGNNDSHDTCDTTILCQRLFQER